MLPPGVSAGPTKKKVGSQNQLDLVNGTQGGESPVIHRSDAGTNQAGVNPDCHLLNSDVKSKKKGCPLYEQTVSTTGHSVLARCARSPFSVGEHLTEAALIEAIVPPLSHSKAGCKYSFQKKKLGWSIFL
ncbi:hypothetical protein PDE_09592 [Penicillium oxalicum 114-2]|uniref:Uncharacterized protein n=1 Tax=Penicillium oxalicum (strain 114-2 / CGMCC 5302) TaxID=933388 RepID=S8B6S7_PENO1|nr:hypothetical protein PDE_09592 [Penicillium oxalicum 114-2]